MTLVVKLSFFILLLMSLSATAQIEKWVDDNGKTHYGSRAPSNSDSLSVKVSAHKSNAPVKPDRVVLYSTSWCPYCKKARDYLTTNGIEFTEYDIEKDATAKRNYELAGARGVPFLVKGPDVQGGFTQAKYDLFFK